MHSRNQFFGLGVCILFVLAGCSGGKSSAGSRNSDPEAGIYEYSNPWPAGYLYYRLELRRNGAHYTGALMAGNYLQKSEAGGYANPNVLVDCSVEGDLENDHLSLTITVTKYDKTEDEAPDLLAVMNFPMLDSASATAWTFHIENNQLTSQSGSLEEDGTPNVLTWEKIK